MNLLKKYFDYSRAENFTIDRYIQRWKVKKEVPRSYSRPGLNLETEKQKRKFRRVGVFLYPKMFVPGSLGPRGLEGRAED